MSTPPGLGLETGINYIASQTIGECYFDATENILTFADIFRPIFAGLAEQCIQEGRGADLMQRAPYIRDRLAAELSIEAPNTSMISFLDFCVEAMRRYVLVKYNEAGHDEATISGWFGLDSLQSSCLATFGLEDPGPNRGYWRGHARERRGSLNRLAGIHAAISGASAASVVTSTPNREYTIAHSPYIPFLTLVQRSIRQIPRLNVMILTQNVEYKKSPGYATEIVIQKPYDYPDYTWREGFSYRLFKQQPLNVNTFAVYYQLLREDRGAGHIIVFLRYRGEYYYCDNQVGIAQPCYRSEAAKLRFISNLGQPVRVTTYSYSIRDPKKTIFFESSTNYAINIQIGNYVLPTVVLDPQIYAQLKVTPEGALQTRELDILNRYREYEERSEAASGHGHGFVHHDRPLIYTPIERIVTETYKSIRAVFFQIRAGQEKLFDVLPEAPLLTGAVPGWHPDGAAAGAGGEAEASSKTIPPKRRKSTTGGRRRTLRKVRSIRRK